MDRFRKKFLEEASELIQNLENSLLQLDVDNVSEALIQEIFRIMHTIKGNSAMFGFKRIDEFTHHLESIYDLVRNGKVSLSKPILDFSFIAIDHIKILLENDNDLPEDIALNHDKLMKKVIKVSEEAIEQTNEDKNKQSTSQEDIEADNNGISIDENSSKLDENNENDENTTNTVKKEGKTLYYILFEPKAEIFKFGNNPFFLIDDITKLGDSKVIVRIENIPPINKITPELCYTYWEIFLETESEENDIKDIFIFVEDDCNLVIKDIGKYSLSEKNISQKLNELENNSTKIDISQINNLFDSKKTEKTKKSEPVKKTEKTEENPKKIKDVKRVVSDIKEFIKESILTNTKKQEVQKEVSISSIRVSSDKLDSLMNLISEMVTLQARLSLFAHESEMVELNAISENLEKVSRRLRDNAFSICLIPLESILTRFQRLVRDVSSELNKDVKFITEGSETELDKSIIESLSDPIMHILRNSLDHGLESKEQRLELGKPAQGTIKLQAYYSGTYVYIDISDDGQGINTQKIKEKAIQKGLIAADANLSRKELLNLIFAPGLSTASKVTELSGRGVGMDVVKRKISEIRGDVEIDSEQGVGTTITIKMPLTLSIIDGLLVQVGETLYVIPLTSVNNIFAASKSRINSYNDLIIYQGEEIPYVYLRREFDEPEDNFTELQFVVVRYNNFKVGLIIDKIIGEYQAVLKPIGKLFKDQDFVSGATILGDGSIALVLDINRTIKQYVNNSYKKAKIEN